MSAVATLTKQALHDKLESQINAAAAKLDTLKARAESAKAHAEVKAIAELLPKKHAIQRKLDDLKKASENQWEHAKTDLTSHVADFEKSVREIEAKVKAH